jgi:hypothetical protein
MIRPMAPRKKRATMIPAIILSANHGNCTNLDSKSVFNFSDPSDNGIHCIIAFNTIYGIVVSTEWICLKLLDK